MNIISEAKAIFWLVGRADTIDRLCSSLSSHDKFTDDERFPTCLDKYISKHILFFKVSRRNVVGQTNCVTVSLAEICPGDIIMERVINFQVGPHIGTKEHILHLQSIIDALGAKTPLVDDFAVINYFFNIRKNSNFINSDILSYARQWLGNTETEETFSFSRWSLHEPDDQIPSFTNILQCPLDNRRDKYGAFSNTIKENEIDVLSYAFILGILSRSPIEYFGWRISNTGRSRLGGEDRKILQIHPHSVLFLSGNPKLVQSQYREISLSKIAIESAAHCFKKSSLLHNLGRGIYAGFTAIDPSLRILILWASIENVFGEDKTNKNLSISARLQLSITAFFAPDRRIIVQKQIGICYSARSKAAHGSLFEEIAYEVECFTIEFLRLLLIYLCFSTSDQSANLPRRCMDDVLSGRNEIFQDLERMMAGVEDALPLLRE